ncbi:MAG: right-handed parallel beta-helix repeat-containing protein [Gemmataceae bacterium]|nr:right-handed parallel beta-helix repeat-containing protein [Gemmataceae bacterium]
MIRSFLRTSRSRGRHVSRRLWLQSLERRETPATFTVTNTLNTGAGSFRQAITDANAAAGDDTIVFDASFNTAKTIALSTGQLAITSNISIIGPGSGLLTVQNTAAASTTSRVLNITGAVVSVSGMKITGGNVSGSGGGINVTSTDLKLTDIILTGNKVTSDGGGLNCASTTATITLDRCTVSGNTASTVGTSDGGGLRFTYDGNLIVRNSTISGNSAARNGGGIYFFEDGQLTIENSTLSGNTSGGTGGAVYFFGTATTPLEIRNTTVTGNKAGTTGGGFFGNYFAGNININSSIVAGNTATTDPDFSFDVAVTAGGGNNLVGVNDVGNLTLSGTNLTGTLTTPLDPMLDPLANNGGLTQTHSLKVGSPAIDAGSNVNSLAFDQRGAGNPRVQGLAADVGAFEAPSVIPSAVMAPLGPVLTAGTTPDVVTLSFLDDLGISVASIGIGNIEIVDPLGGKLAIISVTPTPNTNAKSIVADYKFTVPGGTWGSEDNGTYTVNILPSQVSDIDGTTHFVAGGTVGTFVVDVAATFVVDNAGDIDDGDFSAGNFTLREAVGRANKGTLSNDTISFSPTVFNSASTISLSNGEFLVQSPMTINGPTAALTIDAGGASRHFNINIAANSGNAVALSKLRLINGQAVGGNGGSIINNDEALTLNSVEISSSLASGDGGAISLTQSGASLTVNDSTISNNVATGTAANGGAINVSGNSSVTVARSAISGNTSGEDGGGIYFFQFGTLTIDDTTVSGNSSNVESAGSGGGAIYLFATKATIRSSTISGNRTTAGTFAANGGAISSNSTTTLNVLNSTVAFNESLGAGGGINNSGTSTITVTSSIISNNTATGTGPDVNGTITATYSLLSSSAGATISPASATNILDQDAKLLPLANNGGPTQTHLLGSGSPARNTGSNPAPALANDQRGTGFPRVLQGKVDMGSTESTDPAPVGSLTTVAAIVAPGAAPNTLTVTYSDNESLINVSTIGTTDIEIVDSSSNKLAITKATVDFNTNGTPRIVTYEFSVPGGTWDLADNGTYTVNMIASQVFDTDVVPASVPAGKLGSFVVAIGNSFVVNATNDESTDSDGLVSLREALALANANANPGSADTITFDPTVFATSKTITLALGEFAITEQVSVVGPAAGVTIDAAALSRHFNIDVPTLTGQKVSLSNMTLSNGVQATGNGGSIFNNDESLTLTKVSVSGNTATAGDGGGIALGLATASLTLVDSSVSNNQALDAAGAGGGIFMSSGSSLEVQHSTVSGNLAGQNGGGIYFFDSGAFTMTDSTVSGNKSGQTVTTGFGGAGIYFYGTASKFLVQNSTISSNTATNGFGAGVIFRPFSTSTAIFRNSTIAFNSLTSAAGKGGGIAITGNLILESTIVTGNTAVGGSQNVYQAGANPVAANNSLIGVLDTGDVPVLTGSGNLTGTTATPLDAKLDPTLALNGAAVGSPLTHALLTGSPAINAGNNSAGLAFDQRGNGFARVSGGSADIGAFEVQSATPSVVTSIVINNGAAQRSRVTSVKVNFDTPVTISNPNAAFTLNRVTPSAGAVTLNVVLDGSGLFATITFTGGLVDGAGTVSSPFSLQDGRYTLSVVPSEFGGGGINGNAGVLVSNSFNSTPYVNNLTPATGIFRMFGDATGNGKVESDDFLAFRIAFLTSNDTFDFNGNGQVDSTDFLQFRLHFLSQVV